jgi:RNA polymerase sigma-70 factor (ECF subfamily)
MTAQELQLAIRGDPDLPHEGREAVDHPHRDVLEGLWSDVAADLARLARAMGVPADRVDDVLQEVFVTAWEKAPSRATRQELQRWLIRVTTNRCNLEHRRRKVWRRIVDSVGRLRARFSPVADPRHATMEAEARDLIRRVLESLPPEQRTALVLRYFEGYDARQIGEILEMPHATVRSHLHRARRELARTLIEAGYVHEEERD